MTGLRRRVDRTRSDGPRVERLQLMLDSQRRWRCARGGGLLAGWRSSGRGSPLDTPNFRDFEFVPGNSSRHLLNGIYPLQQGVLHLRHIPERVLSLSEEVLLSSCCGVSLLLALFDRLQELSLAGLTTSLVHGLVNLPSRGQARERIDGSHADFWSDGGGVSVAVGLVLDALDVEHLLLDFQLLAASVDVEGLFVFVIVFEQVGLLGEVVRGRGARAFGRAARP